MAQGTGKNQKGHSALASNESKNVVQERESHFTLREACGRARRTTWRSSDLAAQSL